MPFERTFDQSTTVVTARQGRVEGSMRGRENESASALSCIPSLALKCVFLSTGLAAEM